MGAQVPTRRLSLGAVLEGCLPLVLLQLLEICSQDMVVEVHDNTEYGWESIQQHPIPRGQLQEVSCPYSHTQ